MVARLAAKDYLARWETPLKPWWPALSAVPRHAFVPDTVWVKNLCPVPSLLPLHRADDPGRWLELAYGDDYVVTQVDDVCPEGPGLGERMPTSSASSPGIVAVMLAALDAQLGIGCARSAPAPDTTQPCSHTGWAPSMSRVLRLTLRSLRTPATPVRDRLS